jgi:hypothetical protein
VGSWFLWHRKLPLPSKNISCANANTFFSYHTRENSTTDTDQSFFSECSMSTKFYKQNTQFYFLFKKGATLSKELLYMCIACYILYQKKHFNRYWSYSKQMFLIQIPESIFFFQKCVVSFKNHFTRRLRIANQEGKIIYSLCIKAKHNSSREMNSIFPRLRRFWMKCQNLVENFDAQKKEK